MINQGVLLFMVAMGNANGVVFEYEKIKSPVTINRDIRQTVYAWHEFSCHILDGFGMIECFVWI